MAGRDLSNHPSLGNSKIRRTNAAGGTGQDHMTEAQMSPPWTQRPNNQQRSAPPMTTSRNPLQRSTAAPVHPSTSSAQAHPGNVHIVHPQLSVNYENARRVIPALPPLSQLLQTPSPAPISQLQRVDGGNALQDYQQALRDSSWDMFSRQLQETRQDMQAMRLAQETIEGDVIELNESMTTVIALLRQRPEGDHVAGANAQAQAAAVLGDEVSVKQEGDDTDSLFEDAYDPHQHSFGR